jgi:arginine exporter protein ArgO
MGEYWSKLVLLGMIYTGRSLVMRWYFAYGSYSVAWQFAVGMGLTAGIVQITFAIARPRQVAIT